jgi:hypothetical protein
MQHLVSNVNNKLYTDLSGHLNPQAKKLPEQPNGGVLFFRLDDIGCARASVVELIRFLESLERPYILAIIPDSLTWRMKRFLRSTRHALLFQHGTGHRNRSAPAAQDEFPETLGRQIIQSEIRRGRASLQNALKRDVIGYVPPWNRLSRIGLGVLEAEGFRILSGNSLCKTEMLQMPIHVDVYSQYSPVVLRPPGEIQREIEKTAATLRVFGVMMHPMSVPKGEAKALEDLVRRNAPRTMTADHMAEAVRRNGNEIL